MLYFLIELKGRKNLSDETDINAVCINSMLLKKVRFV